MGPSSEATEPVIDVSVQDKNMDIDDDSLDDTEDSENAMEKFPPRVDTNLYDCLCCQNFVIPHQPIQTQI